MNKLITQVKGKNVIRTTVDKYKVIRIKIETIKGGK